MAPPVAPPKDIVATGATTAAEIVASVVGSLDEALALLRFGAVYRDRIRLRDDVAVRAGEWLRVHATPRRFPAADVRWEARVVAQTPEYLVVDKPAGAPFHATCDNAVENVLHGLQALCGEKLYTLQRLDIGTQGLAVVARTLPFQRRFAGWLEKREVRKHYRALVATAPIVGEYVHYMMPSDRAPRVVAAAPTEGWKPCVLRVTSVTPLPLHDAYEVAVELLTGRNHQIRAQLAALGSPLLGDALYGSTRAVPAVLGPYEAIALQACHVAFPPDREYRLPRPW